MLHWKGGHKDLCQQIKRGAGAEQHHADKKYAEAVTEAAEVCAEDTKGQTCYICTEAVHWKTKEGLVRGCACRGTAGFAHVSCLAEQAKTLREDAEENDLDDEVFDARWVRWHRCGLCEQNYHGVVACALGWGCWKTYVGRQEEDGAWTTAIGVLGNGLSAAHHHADALSVGEAELAMEVRLGTSGVNLLATQGNLAIRYHYVGKHEEALLMRRDVYSGTLKLLGEENSETLRESMCLSSALIQCSRLDEAKSLLCKMIPVARRVLGESHELTLRMRCTYAQSLCYDDGATLDDLREAVTILEDVAPTTRRVLGGAHPTIEGMGRCLHDAQAALCARQALVPGAGSDAQGVVHE